MTITRRQSLSSLLLGTAGLGLRALATGLPATFLASPRRALAGGVVPTCPDKRKAQYIIFNTSGAGDPLNANVPGTYDDPKVVHGSDPTLAPTTLTLAGKPTVAAAAWAGLPQAVLDRASFWHLMTNTPVHPKEPDVLKLMGRTYAGEMLPSLLARHLAPCFGTIQTGPISIGATSPSEALTDGGTPLPIIPPLSLKATLTNPAGALTNLQPLRDQTVAQLYDLYKHEATPAQRAYIDDLATSQAQVRNVSQQLLSTLTSIKDNTAASQMLAAVTLIQMNVAPVIAVHIPFGGDNHRDVGLAAEAAQTTTGVATLATLMQLLTAAGLADQVSVLSLSVFGRTLGPGNTDGRQHNPNHQVSLAIGKPFRGGVVGAVAPVQTDYGATPIEAKTGLGGATGDVAPLDTLAAFGATMLAAVGVDPSSIATDIPSGTIIAGALA